MGLFDYIFGEDEPVKTATPNVKTPVNKSQPVETLTPNVTIPTATPKPEPVTPWMNQEFLRKLRAHETGIWSGDEKAQMSAIGDNGEAVGQFQQHAINVQNATDILAKKRRIVAQEWARKNNVAIGGKEYTNYLNSLPPSKVFNASDRTNPAKSLEIYNINMSDLVQILEKKKGKPLTEVELARAHNAGNEQRYKGNQEYGVRYLKSMGILSEYDKKKKEEEAKAKSKKK